MTEDDFKKIPKLPQRQDSLSAQIVDLIQVANKLGMYDVADWIVTAREKEAKWPERN